MKHLSKTSAVLCMTLMTCLASETAHAHVVLAVPNAEAGSYYKGVFQVGHGCDGSPTREVIIDIPKGVLGIKPMPKVGWKLETEKAVLEQPYETHGKKIAEDVVRVKWSGGQLADNQYDEFVLIGRLPEKQGTLYWPATQVCEQGRMDWSEIPSQGKTSKDYKMPAPRMEVIPKAQPRY